MVSSDPDNDEGEWSPWEDGSVGEEEEEGGEQEEGLLSGEEQPLIRSALTDPVISYSMGSRSDTSLVARPSYVTQYVAGISATFGAMAMGTVLGYSSPAGLQLTSNSTTGIHLDENENTWFASTMNLGALVGGPITGLLMNNIGRKGTMLASIVPFLLGWGLIGFAQNFYMLVGGRVFTGMCCGIMSFVVPTYIGEFASPEIRGTLGAGFQLMVTIGLLYSLVVGSITTWQYLALATAVIPCIFVLLMFFSKESPSYLLSKRKEEEASKSLQYFRGEDYNIQTELDTLRETVHEAQRNKAGFSDLSKPHIMRPLLISLGLMFFQQFSGVNAVLFNLGLIFKSAGSSLSSETSSIIIGVVQVVATLIASILMDKAGRKMLLIISSSVMTISAGALGYYFYEKKFNEEFATDHLSWLPLLALVLFISSFSLGYGPIPWLMMGELFSADVKELAGSIATAFNWTLSFVVTSIFTSLQNTIHDYGVYWLFSGICALNLLFCLTIVKETKGKSLEEISAMFGAPSQKRESEA